MNYLEYKYYQTLKNISEQAPEFFLYNKYINFIKPNIDCYNNKTYDPFQLKEANKLELFEIPVKTFILKGGNVGDSIIAEFYDIREKYTEIEEKWNKLFLAYGNEKVFESIPYSFAQESHPLINEILFFENILTIFSNYNGNPYGMLWLHMWSRMLDLNASLKDEKYLEGLAFIDGLKTTYGSKIKLLCYNVYNMERYSKFKTHDETNWSNIFSYNKPYLKETQINMVKEKHKEEKYPPPYYSYNRDSYSPKLKSNFEPTKAILSNNTDIIKFLPIIYDSKNYWVEPENANQCTLCKETNEILEAYKLLLSNVSYFLCSNCCKNFVKENRELSAMLSKSNIINHKKIAAESLYADEETLMQLAFDDNNMIRELVLENPKSNHAIKTAVKLQQ